MKLENLYTSIACNRTPESADWGNNGLIVFAANYAVGIFDCKFDTNSAKILHTYVQHKKRVNTVRWLRTAAANSAEQYFISGGDDGLAIVWHVADFTAPKHFQLKGHESGVNAVDGVQQKSGTWLLATAAADSTLRLWNFDGKQVECFQTLHLSSGFCFSLRLTLLPQTAQAILAYSSDDETIALWAQPSGNEQNNGEFQRVHKLVGHEDWVRCLDFVRVGDDLLLASSAQDNFIRLWRLSPRTAAQVQENKIDLLNAWDESKDDIRVEEKIIKTGEQTWYAISLESVLYGHDGWVYGVHWQQNEQGDLQLLSASIDKTLIIWATTEDGVWLEKVRVGDVGGNSLGFFGGKFASDGKFIMGHSYQGGFHIWNQSKADERLWQPNVIVGGHFDEVRDLAWEPQEGAYVMTVSADQTTRVHAPWLREAKNETWHELARPQVHGYDMQALAILNRYKFASGAEEKIVRTFQSSANFIENFRRITQITEDEEGDKLLASLPKGASVPSLGLSNKAVYTVDENAGASSDKHIKDEYPENYFVPVTLDMPPQEETLMQNTLWPEVQKLYGHGYEIYALAANANGTILASSCRATNAEHAQIILWNTANWKQIQKLPAHQLTVTQMRFSPDGRYLLSVSRDRRWALFERQHEKDTFELSTSTSKENGVHTRIIWACDWSHDSQLFATTSREGKAVVWQCNVGDGAGDGPLKGWHPLGTLELKGESITAVTFATKTLKCGAYVVALGTETGVIKIYKFDKTWSLLQTLNNDQAHHLTVRRLQFRPAKTLPQEEFQLASCGDDHLTRIYKLVLQIKAK